MMRILISIAALVAWTSLSFWAGREWRDRSADLAESQQQTFAAQQKVARQASVRGQEHQQAEDMAIIGAKHEEDRTAAQAVPAAVVADLRAGNLQLRDDLATCSTSLLSQAVAGAIERDARAELRPEVAGAALRIVTDAEDHVRACQAVINTYRAGAQ